MLYHNSISAGPHPVSCASCDRLTVWLFTAPAVSAALHVAIESHPVVFIDRTGDLPGAQAWISSRSCRATGFRPGDCDYGGEEKRAIFVLQHISEGLGPLSCNV